MLGHSVILYLFCRIVIVCHCLCNHGPSDKEGARFYSFLGSPCQLLGVNMTMIMIDFGKDSQGTLL